eukprot:scaffold59117_cov28-Tisochrysis_lutea.AAC.7
MAPARGKPKVTRPRVYARIRPMFGRDAGKPELFDIEESALTYVKEQEDVLEPRLGPERGGEKGERQREKRGGRGAGRGCFEGGGLLGPHGAWRQGRWRRHEGIVPGA